MSQSLLQVRSKMKDRKPDFIRQDNPKRMKVNDSWRKPKGHHSKIRHRMAGRRKMPSPGYKSPVQVRGLHVTGLKMINVYSLNDVKKIEVGTEGIVVAGAVGKKNRLGILKYAKQHKIALLNGNIDEQISKIEDFVASKKKKAEEKEKGAKEAKKEEKKESESKNELKENPHIQVSEEDKKKAEKEEKDRLLTQRT